MAMLDLICINSITSPFPSPSVIPPPPASLERTENKDGREGIHGETVRWKQGGLELERRCTHLSSKKPLSLFSIYAIQMLFCQQSICSSKPKRLNYGQTQTHKEKIFSCFLHTYIFTYIHYTHNVKGVENQVFFLFLFISLYKI